LVSVTSMDTPIALNAEGIEIDKKKIHLDEPIRDSENIRFTIKLHSEVSAQLNVQVVPE